MQQGVEDMRLSHPLSLSVSDVLYIAPSISANGEAELNMMSRDLAAPLANVSSHGKKSQNNGHTQQKQRHASGIAAVRNSTKSCRGRRNAFEPET